MITVGFLVVFSSIDHQYKSSSSSSSITAESSSSSPPTRTYSWTQLVPQADRRAAAHTTGGWLAECVAAMLSAAEDRVWDLTRGSFPLAAVELQTTELLLITVLLFYSLGGIRRGAGADRRKELATDGRLFR